MKQRGFTLVELMAVVAIVGIMASLAMVGYRKHLRAAHASEVHDMFVGIQAAEEGQRAETLGYLGCSSKLDEYYPHPAPDQKVWDWSQPAHPKFGCWSRLGVGSTNGVIFVYSLVAGQPGETPPTVPGLANQPVWPVTKEPWYVVHAAADQDDDGRRSSFVASSMSFAGGTYSENGDE